MVHLAWHHRVVGESSSINIYPWYWRIVRFGDDYHLFLEFNSINEIASTRFWSDLEEHQFSRAYHVPMRTSLSITGVRRGVLVTSTTRLRRNRSGSIYRQWRGDDSQRHEHKLTCATFVYSIYVSRGTWSEGREHLVTTIVHNSHSSVWSVIWFVGLNDFSREALCATC